jgi:hypothetical protein
MKKLFVLLILVTIASACHGFHASVRGSGDRTKENRNVGSFTSISTEGAFDIQVVCKKDLSLEIEGDDNILSLISTEVSRDVLRIKNTKNYSVAQPVVIRISVPDLQGISSNGAGSIDISAIKTDKFVIDANGAPTIHASGETKELTVDVNGAAKVDTHRLRGDRVTVESKGVSTVEVYASEKLDVTVMGPSHVIYQGNAVVNKTINGPGSVEKKESAGASNLRARSVSVCM